MANNEEQIWMLSAPRHILYDHNLSSFEKLLFVDIMSLTKTAQGCCWATNSFFTNSERWGCSTSKIKRAISNLEHEGYLIRKITYYKGSTQIKERKLYPQLRKRKRSTPRVKSKPTPRVKNEPTPRVKNDPVSKELKESKELNIKLHSSTSGKPMFEVNVSKKSKSNGIKRIKRKRNIPVRVPIQRKRLTPKQLEKRKLHTEYIKIAKSLSRTIRIQSKKTGREIIHEDKQINEWANQIRLLNEIGSLGKGNKDTATPPIPIDDIRTAVTNYRKAIGTEYSIEVMSGSSLRDKFYRFEKFNNKTTTKPKLKVQFNDEDFEEDEDSEILIR